MPGQLAKDTLGSQRALLDVLTIAFSANYPLHAMVRKGPTVNNVKYEWPIDKDLDPEDDAHPDGKDPETFGNANEDYAVLENRIQYTWDARAVGKIAQNVQNQAGITNKRAYAVKKMMKKVMGNIETQLGSDNEMQVDDGTVGNKARGLGVWLQNGAQTPEVPEAYRTPAASIHSAALSNLTESAFAALGQSIWDNTGGNKPNAFICVCGPTLKTHVSDWTQVDTGATNVFAPVRTYFANLGTKAITNTVTRFEGDFFDVDFIPSRYLAFFTSEAARLRRGYILNMNMLDLVFQQRPMENTVDWKNPTLKFYVDAIYGNRMLNPLAHGKISSTT